jgi:hypothetical protein
MLLALFDEMPCVVHRSAVLVLLRVLLGVSGSGD